MANGRMRDPAVVVPGAVRALRALHAAVTEQGGVPATTLNLVHLRASQLNGCRVCVDAYTGIARAAGDTMERLVAVANWRDSRRFTGAERVAFVLTEAFTRLGDGQLALSDEDWDAVALYYDEMALAALILSIAAVNACNRLAMATRQATGTDLLRSAAAICC